MATIKWKYPIEELHGKLRTDFGAAQRKSKNGNGERDPFTVIYGKRDMTNHPLSTAEIAARTRFAAIRALVDLHKCDIQKRMAEAWYPNPQGKYFCYVFDEEISFGNLDIRKLIATKRIESTFIEGAPFFISSEELLKYRV